MTDKLVDKLLNYGVLGIVCVGLGVAVYYIIKMWNKDRDKHAEERREWMKMAEKFNDTTRENIGLIHEIRGRLTNFK